MKLPKLQKIIASPERSGVRKEYGSAVWQVEGMPWVVVGKWELPEGSGWRIFIHDFSEQYPEQELETTWKLKQQLEKQIFRSRTEALQALKAALNFN